MNSLSYVPGDCYALVGTANIIVLPGQTATDTVLGLWEAMDGSEGIEDLLSALLGTVGLKITDLPDFALVSRGTRPHVMVRGAFGFSARGPEGLRSTDAADIATWQEQRFPATESWSVATGAPSDAPALPIGHGIVRVAALHAAADAGQDAVRPEAQQSPAQEPVDTPEPATRAQELQAEGSGTEREAARESALPEPAAEEPLVADAAADEPDAPQPVAEESAADEPAVSNPAALEAAEQESAAVGPVSDNLREDDTDGPEATQLAAQAQGDPQATEASEDTQDPESFEPAEPAAPAGEPEAPKESSPAEPSEFSQPTGQSGEVSLASTLLGRRDDPATQYQTQDPDTADTIIKPRARPAAAADVDHADTVIRHASGPVPPRQPLAESAGTSSAPMILARVCIAGHPNRPEATTCRTCQAKLSGQARQVRQPAMGRMFVTDQSDGPGSSHLLTRSVIIGRQPGTPGQLDGEAPKLMKVASPNNDISRSHVQVKIDGWHVELVDLGATNGTVLLREGQSPRRLGTKESVLLLSGDIADLGDGVTLNFEDLP